MTERLYTEEQLQQEIRLKIIENNQSHNFKSVDRIDDNINNLSNRLDTTISHLSSRIDNLSNKFDTFKYWVLGMMIVQFALILTYVKK